MSTRNLFVGNLEVNITLDELRKIFGAFGNVTDIDVKRPPPGSGNAFAFVRYENLDMAHRAKQELSGNTCSCNLAMLTPTSLNWTIFKSILPLILFSGQFIGKFQCKIGYGKAHPTPKVWVGQLGSWCSESLLWKEFDRFGAIKSIEYLKGDNFAYILYEMVDAAQAAVQEMRGFPLGGPDRRLRLDFADVEGFPETRRITRKESVTRAEAKTTTAIRARTTIIIAVVRTGPAIDRGAAKMIVVAISVENPI